MRRLAPLMLTIAVTAGACGGADDEATPTTPPATSATTEPAPTDAPTTTETTTTTTTVAPTTTIDEAAILAEAEAAYLEAFTVGLETLRNPSDPGNEDRIRDHFTKGNLDQALENLRRTRAGNFVARENVDNPSFVVIVEPGEFVGGDPTVAEMTVCEFNSDRLFELGTAPDGGDALVRDDPVSFLFVTQLRHVDGSWKSETGGQADEIRGEEEQCSSLFSEAS